MIRTTYAGYGTQTIGTTRACSSGGKSEHKDGRALDWMLDSTDPADKALADSFLAWLVGPDAQGVPAGNARRLGVMYVIWNKQSWNAYDRTPAWVPYTGANPHTDHIHISLSWDGALKRTSFWTGVATTRYDYGPCQVYIGEPVEPGPHYDRCPTPRYRPGEAFPRRWDAGPDGRRRRRSRRRPAAALPGHRHRRPSRRQPPGRPRLAGDDRGHRGRRPRPRRPRDLVARRATGDAVPVPRQRHRRLPRLEQIGCGWNGHGHRRRRRRPRPGRHGRLVLAAGRPTAPLLLYRGNGTGGRGRRGSPTPRPDTPTWCSAVGDWPATACPTSSLRVRATGELRLLAGDGRGGLRAAARASAPAGAAIAAVVGPATSTADGRADLLATTATGDLLLFYRGDGAGGFAAARWSARAGGR